MTTNLSIFALGEMNPLLEPQFPICNTSIVILTKQECNLQRRGKACGSIWLIIGGNTFCSSLRTHSFSQKHGFTLFGQGDGCGSPRYQQMVPKNPILGTRPPRPPLPLCHTPAPFPAFLPFSVIPGPRQKVTQNTLCLSADSWKVTLNDEYSWVGLEGSFFSFSFFPFFLSPMYCITGQPLDFIRQTPVVFRPFPILLPLLPFQAPLAKAGYSGLMVARELVLIQLSYPFCPSPTSGAPTDCGPGEET